MSEMPNYPGKDGHWWYGPIILPSPVVTDNNIPRCTELPILGVPFQENCKCSEHVRAKLIKANKCLFVLRSLRKKGFSQVEVDRLFSALGLPNFTYGLSVYGAVDSDLTVIQNFLDRC